MPRFLVTMTVEVEVAQEVIDAVTDEWRSMFYDLRTPEDIAGHVARNAVEGRALSRLDGWGDQPDDRLRITDDLDVLDCERMLPGQDPVTP